MTCSISAVKYALKVERPYPESFSFLTKKVLYNGGIFNLLDVLTSPKILRVVPHYSRIVKIIDYMSLDINETFPDGKDLLYNCVRYNQANLLLELLKRGINIRKIYIVKNEPLNIVDVAVRNNRTLVSQVFYRKGMKCINASKSVKDLFLFHTHIFSELIRYIYIFEGLELSVNFYVRYYGVLVPFFFVLYNYGLPIAGADLELTDSDDLTLIDYSVKILNLVDKEKIKDIMLKGCGFNILLWDYCLDADIMFYCTRTRSLFDCTSSPKSFKKSYMSYIESIPFPYDVANLILEYLIREKEENPEITYRVIV